MKLKMFLSALLIAGCSLAPLATSHAYEKNQKLLEMYYKTYTLAIDNPEKAIQAYDKILSIDSTFYPAILDKGSVYLKLKNYNLAMQEINKGLNLCTNDPESMAKAYWVRGKILYEQGRYQEAVNDYTRALSFKWGKKQEIWTLAYTNRAEAYLALRKFDMANNDFVRKVVYDLEHNPDMTFSGLSGYNTAFDKAVRKELASGRGIPNEYLDVILNNIYTAKDKRRSDAKTIDLFVTNDFIENCYEYVKVYGWDVLNGNMITRHAIEQYHNKLVATKAREEAQRASREWVARMSEILRTGKFLMCIGGGSSDDDMTEEEMYYADQQRKEGEARAREFQIKMIPNIQNHW